MAQRLFKWYQRKRVVNINANIVFAGILAMAFTLLPVYLSGFVFDETTSLGKLLITATAMVFDVIFDVAIYYGLHWIANHWRPLRPKTEREHRHYAAKKPNFVKDATKVQIERALLSPLFYLASSGLMYSFMHFHVLGKELAFVIAFISAILLTRTIHTVWGLRTGLFKDHEHREDGSDIAEAIESDEKNLRDAG